MTTSNLDLLLRTPIIDENLDTYSLSFSPDGQTLAAGYGDGTLRLYNTASGRRLFRMQPQPIEDGLVKYMPMVACCYKPIASLDDPQIILSASSYGQITHFHAYRGTLLHQFQVKDETNQNVETYCLKYANDGSQYAVAGRDKFVRVYDEATNSLMCTLKGGNNVQTVGHSNRIFSVVFHDKNSNILFSSGWDHTTQIWDVRAGHSVASIHDCRVVGDSLDFKNDKLLVGNYNLENQLRIYDLRNISTPQLSQSVSFFGKTISRQVEEFDDKLMERINKIEATTITNEDDNVPEPKIENALPAQPFPQQPEQAENESIYIEPTLIYDAKFAKGADNIVFCTGCGGREVRVYDIAAQKPEMIGCWQAPASCFCAAASNDGRFGAVAGIQFGLQVFSLDTYYPKK